ncbi:MAG: sigma-54-dependent Fis family transcriptional regulator [Acidobacteria bacterium]|nr:sigma-54-dependent Fis family transcriptional regulator [Acidobacteriota bacterium]MBI3422275.1 sigma-54-dependent Fis family transcriptional regulator [Acidobacteriota bacterium]
MKKILVVDDDRVSLDALKEILAAQGWEVHTAQTPQQAVALFARGGFDLVVSDINLEAAQSGLDLLQQFRAACPVILITGFGTLETTVKATQEGAWDLISKPFKVKDVLAVVQRALEHSKTPITAPEPPSFQLEKNGMVGRAPAMLELYKEIARVAPSRSTVLINGESGTGKELVARSIHQHSQCAQGPFVPVNCGALTETLLEAELFGYVKGAFTGAHTDRRGLWEEATGGTLFLDEIGEISLAMQVKLLRALQEKEIRRVGATRNVHVDARVVTATNRELKKEVAQGRFREDLYYRLKVFTLHAPALRERRSDIPLLAERFLQGAQENAARTGLKLTEETLRTLVAYDWPGNVRELESAIEYAALHAHGAELQPVDLPPELQGVEVHAAAHRSPLAALFDDLPTLDELERRYLLHALAVVGGSKTKTAAVLGIDRRTLYRMAERFKINLTEGEEDAPSA